MVNSKKVILTCAQASYYWGIENRGGEKVPVLKKWGNHGDPAVLNKNLYRGLKRYLEEKGGELRIFGIQGCSLKEDVFHKSVEKLPEMYSFSRKFEKLNDNITQSDIRVPPQNIDPATSRLHLPSRYRSTLIIPHPKQRLCPAASFQAKLPRFIVGTGAITSPNYNRENDRGDEAWRDHIQGALLVEIVNNVYYHMRFLTAQKNGKFPDLGWEYNGGRKPKKIKTKALVWGDLHLGEQDPETMQANYRQIDELKPESLYLHDLCSLKSIAHHDLSDLVGRSRRFEEGMNNPEAIGLFLERDLRFAYQELVQIARRMKGKKVYVVHPNHHDFLPKYINMPKQWMERDTWNMGIVSQIISKKPAQDEYLKTALGLFGKIPSNVYFLPLHCDHKVLGYQLASHGHKGKNGARGGNARTKEKILGKSISGHTHSPEQFRDTGIVGTSSRFLDYMHGSSSGSMAANAAIYENGISQLTLITRGKYKLDE